MAFLRTTKLSYGITLSKDTTGFFQIFLKLSFKKMHGNRYRGMCEDALCTGRADRNAARAIWFVKCNIQLLNIHAHLADN